MKIKMKAHFDSKLFDKDTLLAQFHLEKGGIVQQTIDKEVIEQCAPYCPWETGAMALLAFSATQIGSGEVVYPGPYAHYMYYGEVYGPNIPIFDDNTGDPTGFFSPPGIEKTPTGRELQYSKDVNPLAGPFWCERMKADHMDDIMRVVQKVIKGKQ